MRIQYAALVVLLATLLSTMFAQTTWSQAQDPFGSDPFAADPKKANRQRSFAPPGLKAYVAKPKTIGHAATISSNGLDPVRVSVVNQHESEKRIISTLGNATTHVFIETPLREAIETISRNHDIPIVIDRRALEEIGLDSDIGVNINLKNVSLRSFLRLMLRDLDLTYLIKDEVMQITTVEAAEQNLVTQMYRLPDSLAAKSGDVLKALQSAIVPDTWNTLGGPSSATTIDHVLIISTTSDVHDQVTDFLRTLVEAYGE